MDEQQQPFDREKEPRFESDTQKLFRKHMADPDHQITDEELAQVRIGMTPGPDEPTQQAIEDAGQRIADIKMVPEDETLPGAQRITPWDVTT